MGWCSFSWTKGQHQQGVKLHSHRSYSVIIGNRVPSEDDKLDINYIRGSGAEDMMALLLDRAADANSGNVMKLLDEAANGNNEYIVEELLLGLGADTNALDV